MTFILINGNEYPAPDVGAVFTIATFVTNGKNALGEFIGQKVGRDQIKIDNLQWKFLPAEIWARILGEFDNFVVTATVFDMQQNRFRTLRMYPGNRSAVPVEFNEDGSVKTYKDCKVNIIDCGVMGE